MCLSTNPSRSNSSTKVPALARSILRSVASLAWSMPGESWMQARAGYCIVDVICSSASVSARTVAQICWKQRDRGNGTLCGTMLSGTAGAPSQPGWTFLSDIAWYTSSDLTIIIHIIRIIIVKGKVRDCGRQRPKVHPRKRGHRRACPPDPAINNRRNKLRDRWTSPTMTSERLVTSETPQTAYPGSAHSARPTAPTPLRGVSHPV